MKHYTKTLIAAAVAVAGITGCSNDLNRNASPVELVATNSQNLNVIDLNGGTRCTETIATVSLQAFLKNPTQISDQTFNQVRINRYQVSYVRTDGGKIVPATFVRSIDNLLTPGGSPAALSGFQAFEVDAINHAPFQALFPNNGGRDPETGRPVVSLDAILTIFGETLAGERVSATTRVPLDFCFQCGGCG
ncbi:MAG TPA: hypothetical protein VGR02_07390 [Thermoanaerobaculia bacterium]|jgi:hypothetical protein|nr:hypothetical protein [Thermoanaerobaculia bacterium]